MKKICITGASRWIGLAEALKLKNWNQLFLCASKLDSFQWKQVDDCQKFGYDLSKLESIENFTKDISAKTDFIDVLVNNVGVMIMKKFEDYTEEDINYLLDINLRANIILTKKILPLLLKSTDPQIVFMSSMAAKSSINWESVYAAAKAWITNFANVLRNEFAGKIRVSTIHSWWVNTFGASEDIPLLKAESVADVVEFVINQSKPIVIESVDLSHELQWRWWNAPWSPGF